MAERKCLRCGGVLTPSADEVCVPCLLRQGEAYQRTGNVRAFARPAPREVTHCVVCGAPLRYSSYDPCEGYYYWCPQCGEGPYGPYRALIVPEVRQE